MAPTTLTIDIGGTGIKLLPVDGEGRAMAERVRELTPTPSTPEAVMALVGRMIEAAAAFDRLSVGFPGVVMHGVVRTAPNLGTERWRGFDLQAALAERAGRPARVLNDADLQGYGVIERRGVEMVLTLGTGFGTALYVNGHLVPNLELAHHPLRDGSTYEDLVRDSELERVGAEEWSGRVREAIAAIEPIFNYDLLHVGGGNARRLTGALPENVRLFTNVQGMIGGIRLWDDPHVD